MEKDEEPRRKYRLNKKKFTGFLVVLGFITLFIAIAVYSLNNAGAAIAGVATTGQPTDTYEQSAVKSPVTSAKNTEPSDNSEPSGTTQAGGALKGRLIVVDAGHGGFDPGTIAADGTQEDDLNLAIALKLEAELEGQGAKVIMTRKDGNAIAETKEADMAKRSSIIVESHSDIFISIHMNSFNKDTSKSGPLVLFEPGSEKGKALAECVQKSLNDSFGAQGIDRSEDLQVLRSGSQPCILVECGFLSNKEEEQKLKTDDYQQEVAEAICDGAIDFFSIK